MFEHNLFRCTKRMSIVICVDVSPHMGSRHGGGVSDIDIINEEVTKFVNRIKIDARVCASVQLAFVTFSTNIEMNTAFVPICRLDAPIFQSVEEGGTNMAPAVLESINKIETERSRLEAAEIPYYTPVFILITDGNPDNSDDSAISSRALSVVKKHCDTNADMPNIIIPFIIGIGADKNIDILDEYASGFSNKCIRIRSQKPEIYMEKGFDFIFQCIRKMVYQENVSDDNSVIKMIASDMWEFLN